MNNFLKRMFFGGNSKEQFSLPGSAKLKEWQTKTQLDEFQTQVRSALGVLQGNLAAAVQGELELDTCERSWLREIRSAFWEVRKITAAWRLAVELEGKRYEMSNKEYAALFLKKLDEPIPAYGPPITGLVDQRR